MVGFFISLLKQKLPQRCPKRGGGGGGGSRPLLDNVQKEAAFFQDYFPKVGADACKDLCSQPSATCILNIALLTNNGCNKF